MDKKRKRIMAIILCIFVVLTVWISYSNISVSDSGEEHGKLLKETYGEVSFKLPRFDVFVKNYI